MPILHSAEKRMRADQKRHGRNLTFKSELKTLTKRFLKLVQTGPVQEAQNVYRALVKRLDQAAGKHLIHRNVASRKKSRLHKRLNKSTSQAKK